MVYKGRRGTLIFLAVLAASLVILSSAIITTLAFGGTWVTLADMPSEVEGYAAAAVDGKIYYVGGFSAGSDRRWLRIYDIVTDSWSTGATLPRPRRAEFGAASNGTHIFVVGGRRRPFGGVVFNILDVYDPSTDSWTRLSSMPVALATEYVVTYYKGKIYVTGGRTGTTPGLNPVRYFLIYDVASDTWSFGPDLPFNVSDAATIAFPLLEKIYVFGGIDASGNVLNTVLIYDVNSGVWSYGTPMPEPKADAAVGICLGKILVIGGWNGTSTTRTVLVYDPFLDVWDYGPPLPSPKAQTQGVTVMHPGGVQAIHVAGGGFGGVGSGTSNYAFICPEVGGSASMSAQRSGLVGSNVLLLSALILSTIIAGLGAVRALHKG